MKKRVLFFYLLFLATILGAGATIVGTPTASSDGNGDVTINWQTSEEVGVKEFQITRCSPPSQDYITIGNVAARGSNSKYTFLDKNAYKTTSDLFFRYKILILDNDGNPTLGSFEVPVIQNLSGYKRTWGSIKAMFR
jgi:hypothetical protein